MAVETEPYLPTARRHIHHSQNFREDVCSPYLSLWLLANFVSAYEECSRTVSKTTANKKVLLRERKRHTDCGVSRTQYAVLSWGGVDNLGGGGGGRYLGAPLSPPPLGPGWGVGSLAGCRYLGVPPVSTWPGGRYLGVPPHQDLAGGGGGVRYLGWGGLVPWGTPSPIRTWPGGRYLGVPPSPPIRTWPGGVGTLGYPFPPGCGQTDTCENSTLPSYYVRGR